MSNTIGRATFESIYAEKSRRELYDAFADGWEVESAEPDVVRGHPATRVTPRS